MAGYSHLLLFFFFVLVIFFVTGSSTAVVAYPSQAAPPPELPVDHGQTPDNRTAYRASKLLCWGCLREALEFLLAHNMVRAAHGELPLVCEARLERYARWWAGQRRGDCRPQHSFPAGGFTLGENIFRGSGASWTPSDAVAAWAAEENACREAQVCGHYTQIVWRSTRLIGCARAVCDGGDVFMTCNYNPPGNYIGERPY